MLLIRLISEDHYRQLPIILMEICFPVFTHPADPKNGRSFFFFRGINTIKHKKTKHPSLYLPAGKKVKDNAAIRAMFQ